MSLNELQTAAALAEQVYRRADKDQQLADSGTGGIGVSGISGLSTANVVEAT
jgi:hypothetical protein